MKLVRCGRKANGPLHLTSPKTCASLRFSALQVNLTLNRAHFTRVVKNINPSQNQYTFNMGLQDRDYMHERHKANRSNKDFIYNPKIFRSTYNNNYQTTSSRVKNGSRSFNIKFAALFVVIFLCSISIIEYKRTIPSPETGHTYWFVDPTQDAKSILKIEAPKNSKRKYVVQLNNAQTHQPVAQIFINPGETSVTVIPLGIYEVITHKGIFWQGSQHLFGVTGWSQKMTGTLNFFKTSNNQFITQRLRLDANLAELN
jgi:hypothetical protein